MDANHLHSVYGFHYFAHLVVESEREVLVITAIHNDTKRRWSGRFAERPLRTGFDVQAPILFKILQNPTEKVIWPQRPEPTITLALLISLGDFGTDSIPLGLEEEEVDPIQRLEAIVLELKQQIEAGKPKLTTIPLPLSSTWKDFGDEYASPSITKQGEIVIIEGLVIGTEGTLLATLPLGYRPARRLIFAQNTHEGQCRVDVCQNGEIHYVAGPKPHDWISLAGITFIAENNDQIPLTLCDGWKDYGTVYSHPSVLKDGGIVIIEGLVTGTNGTLLARLPTGYRPARRLIFACNTHEGQCRVDVCPNGEIHYVVGPKPHNWISLSGITFYGFQ